MSAADKKYKLLLPSTMARAGWDVLARRAEVQAVAYDTNMPTAAFHALLADVDGVALSLNGFGAAEIAAGPRVRVVARHGVGYDAVDVPALTRSGIPLMVTGTANSPSVAEQALHFMLALAKRGAPMHALVQSDRWGERLTRELPDDLFGKTVLVVGFGRIGTRIARACLALGMTVRVYDPYVPAKAIDAAGCRAENDLDAALPHADFVTIHCPKTAETAGMFGAQRLARMKASACLVNTARGGIVDETALHRALTTGVIRAAGLDVFEREPPSPDNPLLRLANVLTAPHMAGVTKESFDRMAVAVAENLLSVLDGKPNVDNVVNREVLKHR
ncbi:MAG TPA: hydroxyacid dehydrogenase [Burkholderiales bacterium]|nr:hydroxyacid dehydrogenase [Burkholderiales bacterium]